MGDFVPVLNGHIWRVGIKGNSATTMYLAEDRRGNKQQPCNGQFRACDIVEVFKSVQCKDGRGVWFSMRGFNALYHGPSSGDHSQSATSIH